MRGKILTTDIGKTGNIKNELSGNNFNGIDLVKFLCTFLICIIHTTPFSFEYFKYADICNFFLQKGVCRIAVPFYFVASGFFLFRKIDLNNFDVDRIKNYCFKLIRLWGMWMLLLVLGGTYHLWYLSATAVAVMILSVLLYHRVKFRYITIIAVLLYIVGLLGDSYYGIIEPLKGMNFLGSIITEYETVFSSTRNGPFMGFIFVFMGAVFAYKKININVKVAFLGFVISMGLLVIESFMLNINGFSKAFNMYISLLPATFFLFHIATNINLKDSKVYGKMRVIGVLIYYLHLLAKYFTRKIFVLINEYTGVDLTAFLCVASILLAILMAVLIEALSHKEKFKWLHILYS